MRRTIMLAGAAALSLLVAVPVRAHHAFAAAYDENLPLDLQGTVTKVLLVNPHSFIWIDVKAKDGTTVHWEIEGGPPNSLLRHGFTRRSLPVGSQIRVVGYQSKFGPGKAVGAFLTYADGRKVFMGGSAPGALGQPTGGDQAAPR